MLNYVLRAKQFKAKKSLGQNFLVSQEIIDFIANLAHKEDEILEIGAGLGFVTEKLIEKSKFVTALEIDKSAIKILNKNLSKFENFKLVEKDILKTNIDELGFSNDKITIIANIPYYITSPIIVHLLGEIDDENYSNRKRIKEINLMVQKEVAQRIVATPNSKNKEYGALSILSQMWAEVEIIKDVPKKCFMPSPKVDSAIVNFKIKSTPKTKITRLLKRTVKAIFSSRRKNIKNSLQQAGFLEVEKVLSNLNMSVQTRGETLSVEEISALSVALEEFN
ncbi:ribosomal RNA small subunit methyltransferase A [bacterium]|nr:ribosomal RNA small subunit methyltransferase A [bacterium]